MIAASVICSIYIDMRAFTKQDHNEVKTVFPSHYVKPGMKLISSKKHLLRYDMTLN